jgi:hypothetical protein
MAQSGFTPILIYGSTTPGNTPLAADLATGANGVELAVNAADGKLFYKDHLGVVKVLATAGTGSIGGLNTQVQFNNNGVLGGSANLTWNGSILTSTGFSGPIGGVSPDTGAFTTLTATTVNGITITQPLTGATLTLGDGKTLTFSNTLTFTGTDGTSFAFPGASDTVVTLTATQTLTNKRMTSRVSSVASITSPLAWNSNNFDQYAATAQASSLTINADSGAPTDGQKIIFRLKDNGTARTITWATGVSNGFQEIGVLLPSSTSANKTTYVGAIYNASTLRWDVVAVTTQT